MKRKRFIKKMRAMGFERNSLNYITKRLVKKRNERRALGEKVTFTYERIYTDFVGIGSTVCTSQNERKI